MTSHTTASRPHVLYVAWGFAPMAGGGSYRTLATANMLAEAGFDVTVLTTERDAFVGLTGVDPGLEDRIDPRIDVVRVPFSLPLKDFNIRNWSKERAANPKEWSEHYKATELDDFPEPVFGHWRRALVAEAERIHRHRPVDLVVGSANPHVVMAAGDHLHTLFGVPYVIDHRDAWRLHCYLGVEVFTDDPRVAELETRFFENAHEIWFVNEPIRAWHAAMYPQAAHKMRVVENGFDPAFAPSPHLSGPGPDRPLAFTYIGTLGVRVPIAEMVDGWVQAREQSPEIARARADIWGGLRAKDWSRAALLAEAAEYGLHYHGLVAKDDVAGLYNASDVLLLILGKGRYVTSGKLYEYLATGLPIVSVHEPGNGASDILRDYPLWFPASDITVDGVAEAVVAAGEAARSADDETRRECVEFGQKYERSLQLREPVEGLYRFARDRQGVGA